MSFDPFGNALRHFSGLIERPRVVEVAFALQDVFFVVAVVCSQYLSRKPVFVGGRRRTASSALWIVVYCYVGALACKAVLGLGRHAIFRSIQYHHLTIQQPGNLEKARINTKIAAHAPPFIISWN